MENTLRVSQQSVVELCQRGNLAGAIEVLIVLGDVLAIQGKLSAAVSKYQEALSLNPPISGNDYAGLSLAYTGLGVIQYEWDQFEVAFQNLKEGHRLSAEMGISEQVTSAVALANAFISIGDLENAGQLLEEYEFYNDELSLAPVIKSSLSACRLRFYTEMRDFRSANWVIEERKLNDPDPANTLNEPEWMALVGNQLRRGQSQKAIELARSLETQMAAGGRVDRQIKMLVIEAIALQTLKEPTAALSALTRAVNLGAQEGYLRSFLDFGDSILDLIVLATRPNAAGGDEVVDSAYFQKIGAILLNPESRKRVLSALPENSSPLISRNSTFLIEPLTNHELKILRLIAVGYKKAEIASELGVTVNTVKTHVTCIYNKLGAHNRVQAVNLAKQLGLL
jgi:LuxR family maltose regulon positive regulatory protein